MSNDTPSKDAPKPNGSSKQPSKATLAFKKFFITLVVLLVFVLLFGQLLPRLLDGFSTTSPEERQPTLYVPQASEVAPPPPAPTVTSATTEPSRVAEIQAKLDALETLVIEGEEETQPEDENVENPYDQTRLEALESKVLSMEDELYALKLHAQANYQLRELKSKLNSAAPYTGELTRLNELLDEEITSTALETLSEYATLGVPTLAQLQKELTDTIPQALAQASSDSAIMKNLQSLVTIRKVGEPEGSDDEAILARMEAHLSAGKIEASLTEMRALSAPAKQSLSQWESHMQAYISAHNAVKILEHSLQERLALYD